MANTKVPFLRREAIEQAAEEVLKRHGQFVAPVDPIRIAQALNARVFNAVFNDTSISGILSRRGPTISMLINASDHSHRKRFTIAHELGHLVLQHFAAGSTEEEDHADTKSDLFRMVVEKDAAGTDWAEVQANMFAAALLMPAELVRASFRVTKDPDRLARLFQVSPEAMGNRLNTLGLLA